MHTINKYLFIKLNNFECFRDVAPFRQIIGGSFVKVNQAEKVKSCTYKI